MALKDFLTPGSYSRINNINICKDPIAIYFNLTVYETEDGPVIFGPVEFAVDFLASKKEYCEANPIALTEPEYPPICAEREAMVPMWTDGSTDEEKAEYEAAKAQYEADMAAHDTALSEAETALYMEAEANNEYSQYFADDKVYQDSNATAQAYIWLKTLPGFEGVSDV